MRASHEVIHSLRLAEGGFFSDTDDESSSTVCVLGESAKVSLLGYAPAVGKHGKVNDTWLEVVGAPYEQLAAGSPSSGGSMQDINNIVYIPLNTMQYRYWDQSYGMKDELDGLELRLKAGTGSIEVAKVVTSVASNAHRDVQDLR